MRAYLAYTPFHLLLSLALQHRDGSPEAVLLFADEAKILPQLPPLGDVLRREFELTTLPRVTGRLRALGPIRSRKATRSTLAAVKGIPDLDVLFVLNGQNRPALSIGTHFQDAFEFSYVEDGLDAYLPVNFRTVGPFHRRAHVLAFGWNHPHLIDMTEALPFSSWNVLFPEVTRLRVDTALIDAIPADCLRWATTRLETALAPLSINHPVTHLYLLGIQEDRRGSDSALFALRTWIDTVMHDEPKATLAVKPHPRETNRRLLDAVGSIGGVQVLPPWLPAEMLTSYLAADVTIRCDLTTFAMTSRILLPGRSVELEPTVAVDASAMLHRWDPTITQIGSPGS